MGLLKAGIGSLAGVAEDQFREYFYCDALSQDVLVAKAKKRTTGRGGNKGSENIITNGSVIAVNEGQCMLIVENGKIAEVTAEPGEFVYDNASEPTIFIGDMKESLTASFERLKYRFSMGGETGNDQRIYFFNTKEIMGNKYGTASPVPFRVVDRNIGLDVDISIRCNGEYSYKIVDPVLFYTNVCGNVADEYTRDNINTMLRTELMTALQPAFAKLSEMGLRYSALPGHTLEVSQALNDILSEKWTAERGIEVASFGINSISASKEDEEMIKQLQKSAIMRDPNMAAATLVGAQADAMRTAAANDGGAAVGFMGMNMAQNTGGMNAQNLYAMGANNAPAQPSAQANGWTCECGCVNTGKFCSNCGKKNPADQTWTCACGTVNKGNFCSNCGAKKQ